jgi:hypothetical protein
VARLKQAPTLKSSEWVVGREHALVLLHQVLALLAPQARRRRRLYQPPGCWSVLVALWGRQI